MVMPGHMLLTFVPLSIGALLSVGLALYAWGRREVPGAKYFALSMVAVAAWSAASAMTYLSASLATKILWTDLQYIGITVVPFAWLLFSMAYTGYGERIIPRVVGLLALHPLLTNLAIWTNGSHRLFRIEAWLVNVGSQETLGNTMGPLFWLHTAYAYGLLLAGFYLLARYHLQTASPYRRQGAALLIALVVPWGANVATLLGPATLAYVDLTPFAFAVSGAVIAWALWRHRLLDLVPVARDAAMRSLSSGVIVLDPSGRVVDLNPAAEATVGLAAKAAVGQDFRDVLPEAGYLLSRYRDVNEGRDEIIVGDGEGIFDFRISALHGPGGRRAGHLVTLQDITASKQSQLALSRYAERLRLLYEIDQAILTAQSPERIAVAALEAMRHLLPSQRTSVLAFNADGSSRLLATRAHGKLARMAAPAPEPVWCTALTADGLAADAIVHINDLDRAPNKPPWAEALRADGVRACIVVPLRVRERTLGSLNLEAVMPGVFTVEHIDMVTQAAMSLAVALENAQLYAAAQQELADREAAERALRESEVMLREKAEDLTSRNLELDAFAHTVAHDLKVPLSLLVGYTSFIEAGGLSEDPEQLSWCLEAISQSAHKMNCIVDELLLLASVRRVGDVEVSPVDMESIISDVLLRFSDLIQQRQATIILPDVWPIAAGYAPWIEEVWANYLSNALKYGGDPPLIELGAAVEEDNVNNNGLPLIRFWVQDNGDGLSEAQQERIFTPFERLDQVRAKGHGLGLSIVQRIIEKLGGKAGVESSGEPGQGSTFYFTLDAADLR